MRAPMSKDSHNAIPYLGSDPLTVRPGNSADGVKNNGVGVLLETVQYVYL